MIVAKSHETSFVDACSNLSSIANIANANLERSVRKTSFLCTFSRIHMKLVEKKMKRVCQ